MARGVDEQEAMKRMVALLQEGAVMLQETCPICGLPLFKRRNGEIVCPIHGRVYIVSSDEEAREIEVDAVIRMAEYTAASRVRELLERGEPGEIREWLSVIETVERIRRIRSERERMEKAGESSEAPRRRGGGGEG